MADASFALARFHGVLHEENRVPGALENVIAGGVTWIARERGVFGALRLRHFGSCLLVEDNGVRQTSSTRATRPLRSMSSPRSPTDTAILP